MRAFLKKDAPVVPLLEDTNSHADGTEDAERSGQDEGSTVSKRNISFDSMCAGIDDEEETAPPIQNGTRVWEVSHADRAQRNWHIMKTMLMAIGMFKLAGLNRQRAKELSAAEVKRGLRRNRSGAGQSHVIPTMSFYSPKSEAGSSSTYQAFCDQYARFSPACVHRSLYMNWKATGQTEPKPLCERFWTTLFFADISGFTRLSARLNAEQLKTHTNQYFTMLIDVVARYGGDIIKFCGDAVMILWPCDMEAAVGVQQANAVQASMCALVMLSECGEYDVGKGKESVSLRLHCGVGCGPMYGYTVGIDDRWEYLIAGDPLRQIGEAEPEATQGQVIVSPEVWELISRSFNATRTPKGNFLLRDHKQLESHHTSSAPDNKGSFYGRYTAAGATAAAAAAAAAAARSPNGHRNASSRPGTATGNGQSNGLGNGSAGNSPDRGLAALLITPGKRGSGEKAGDFSSTSGGSSSTARLASPHGGNSHTAAAAAAASGGQRKHSAFSVSSASSSAAEHSSTGTASTASVSFGSSTSVSGSGSSATSTGPSGAAALHSTSNGSPYSSASAATTAVNSSSSSNGGSAAASVPSTGVTFADSSFPEKDPQQQQQQQSSRQFPAFVKRGRSSVEKDSNTGLSILSSPADKGADKDSLKKSFGGSKSGVYEGSSISTMQAFDMEAPLKISSPHGATSSTSVTAAAVTAVTNNGDTPLLSPSRSVASIRDLSASVRNSFVGSKARSAAAAAATVSHRNSSIDTAFLNSSAHSTGGGSRSPAHAGSNSLKNQLSATFGGGGSSSSSSRPGSRAGGGASSVATNSEHFHQLLKKQRSGRQVPKEKDNRDKDDLSDSADADDASLDGYEAAVTINVSTIADDKTLGVGGSSGIGGGSSSMNTSISKWGTGSTVGESLEIEEASQYLGDWIEAQYSGLASLSMSVLSKALRGYTQESARHAIESKTVGYLAELRRVTTIFINIGGLEEHLLQGALFYVQQVMELGVRCMSIFGGVVRQFVVDDKGCVMIAAFGLPQYSYEDNEVRAISASQEMVQALQGLNLHASIGITTGSVYCGFVGAEKRCEYAMMGACVNLSARLMAAAAKNTINVDGEVYQRAHKAFRFDTLTPINAKGYSDPVPVFRPAGQLAPDGSSSSQRLSVNGRNSHQDMSMTSDADVIVSGDTLAAAAVIEVDDCNELIIGAVNEMSVLVAMAKRVGEGTPIGPVILLGQAGSGKTHVLQSSQVRQLCYRHKMESVMTVCRNVHANTPYYIWRSILWRVFHLSTTMTVTTAAAAAAAAGTSAAAADSTAVDSSSNSNDVQAFVAPPPLSPFSGFESGFNRSPSIAGNRAMMGAYYSNQQQQQQQHTPAAVAAATAAAATAVSQPAVPLPSVTGKANLLVRMSSSTREHVAALPAVTLEKPDGTTAALRKTSDFATAAAAASSNSSSNSSRVHPLSRTSHLLGAPCQQLNSTAPAGATATAAGASGPRPLSIDTSRCATVSGGRHSSGAYSSHGSNSSCTSTPTQSPRHQSRRLTAMKLYELEVDNGEAHADSRRSSTVTTTTSSSSSSRRTTVVNASTGAARASSDSASRKASAAFEVDRLTVTARQTLAGSTAVTAAAAAAAVRRERSSDDLDTLLNNSIAQSQAPAQAPAAATAAEGQQSGAHWSSRGGAGGSMISTSNIQGGGAQVLVATEWIRTHVPEQAAMIPLLEMVMSCGFTDTVATAVLDPETRHRRLDRLVIEILRAASAAGPLLVVAENTQWMDMQSMKLMHKVARAQLNMMLVISARPLEEYFETIPQEFIALKEMGTTVEMRPLTPDECLELTRVIIGESLLASHPEVLPEGSANVLLEKSGGGNPLFVRNIATTLKEELVSNKGAPRRLEDLPAGFFHDLIVSRFDALERMEQTALKAASVIGTTFSMRLLLHMLPHTSRDKRGDLHSALLKLIEANFISRTVVGKTERFNFVHSSVQETIYKMMLTDQRQQLHQICAAWYEQHFKNSMTYVSLITHHWLRSACVPKKVLYLQRAADHAKVTFSNEEAIQHLSALVALAFGKDAATAQLMSLRRYWDKAAHVVPAQAPPAPPKHHGSVALVPTAAAAAAAAASGRAASSRSPSAAGVSKRVFSSSSRSGSNSTTEPAAGDAAAATTAIAAGAGAATAASTPVNAASGSAAAATAAAHELQCKQQHEDFECGAGAFTAALQKQWQRLLSLATTPFAGAFSAAEANDDPELGLGVQDCYHNLSTTVNTLPGSAATAAAAAAATKRGSSSSAAGSRSGSRSNSSSSEAPRFAARSDGGRLSSLASLTQRERRLLAARERCWLFAHDLTTCTEFSDPELFDARSVGRWIGEIGLAYHQLGRLLPAHNYMQEALLYLGFEPVPYTLMQKYAALLRGELRTRRWRVTTALFGPAAAAAPQQLPDPQQGIAGAMAAAASDADVLMAARLYEGITSICLKTGHAQQVCYVSKLALQGTRHSAAFAASAERARLLAHFAMGELSRHCHRAATADLLLAKQLAAGTEDSATQGFVFFASGTFQAGQGLWDAAETDFNTAFELFAPVGDTSRCGEVMIESAYVKLCTGDLPEALSMFEEVCDMALRRQDQFLSLTSLYGLALVHALAGRVTAVQAAVAQCRGLQGGSSRAHSNMVLDALTAYVEVSRCRCTAALSAVLRAIDRFCRPGQVVFSVGLFLHLLTDALFTALEYDAITDPSCQIAALRAARKAVRGLQSTAQVLAMTSPLAWLARARWALLHDRQGHAERCIDAGLAIAERADTRFPLAAGLLLLHSTRLKCLPDEERRARARQGRKLLGALGCVLITLSKETSVNSASEADTSVTESAAVAAAPAPT